MIRTSPYRPLPYYRWFWQDWRANRNVQRMTYVERGLYRELLDECWAEGFIPTEMQDLADICDCPVDVMLDAWPRLEKCFDLDADGKMVNTRLNIERTEKDSERVKRSEAGRKGGIAKTKATDSEAQESTSQANASKCLANASNCHIEGELELVIEGEEERSKALVTDESATKSDARPRKADPVPYDVILEAYRRCLPNLPQPIAMTPRRKAGARSIWSQYKKSHEPDFWERYFTYVSKQEFICNMKAANLGWLLNFENMCKVIEGNYE